jgi:hypothetical protein
MRQVSISKVTRQATALEVLEGQNATTLTLRMEDEMRPSVVAKRKRKPSHPSLDRPQNPP